MVVAGERSGREVAKVGARGASEGNTCCRT